MNYRHAFHAGNFADVIKHLVLTRVLTYLHEKTAAFRVVDTHAGAGRYDLTGEEARRSDEWRHGIARLMTAELPPTAAALARPYLDIVRAFNPAAEPAQQAADLSAYPGSPLIARALLRPQDRMVLCETESQARKQLIAALRRDEQARVVDLDGWMALAAFVPPNERRGVVLVDPPFEQAGEFDRLAQGFAGAFGKWPTGIYLLWYPVKDARAAGLLERQVADTVAAGTAAGGKPREKCLRLVFFADAVQRIGAPLAAAGLLIVNPPWTLRQELATLMPALTRVLGQNGSGRFSLDHP